MIDPIDNGGPAFAAATCGDWQVGMSLRDWFAGQAIIGILPISVGNLDAPKQLAVAAYEMADAMIAARKEKS